MSEPVCAGQSGQPGTGGKCPARPRYEITWSQGRGPQGEPTVATRWACGHHLSWVINYVTVPDRTVAVKRLW